jgi:hypothetical protein
MKTYSTSPESAGEHEITQTISGFLRDGPTILQTLNRSAFPKNIETLLTCFSRGNIQAFARYLRVNRSSIIGWKTRIQLPTLLSLMDVSHKFNVSPVALLSAVLRPEEFTLKPSTPGHSIRRRFVSPPRPDAELMRRVLEEAVKSDLLPRPSLSKLAARVGCRQTTLNRRFPDLVKQVKERHQQ